MVDLEEVNENATYEKGHARAINKSIRYIKAMLEGGWGGGEGGGQGEQGPPGPQGPQGVPGPKGDQGIQGIQGIQGVKGDKGDKGDQGIQGIQGPQGVKGDKGDTGPQGPAGTGGGGLSITGTVPAGNANTDIVHNFNTKAVNVVVFATSNDKQYYVDVTAKSVTTVTLGFGTAPTADQYYYRITA